MHVCRARSLFEFNGVSRTTILSIARLSDAVLLPRGTSSCQAQLYFCCVPHACAALARSAAARDPGALACADVEPLMSHP